MAMRRGGAKTGLAADDTRETVAALKLVLANELNFAELFEEASDVVVINDRDGVIVAANRAAREFGGYSVADVERGVHIREIMPPEEVEAALLLTQRALDGLPYPQVYEREVILRDGSRRMLELRSNVLHRNGVAAFLQTIARDVTDKKAAAAFQAALLHVSQALLTAQRVDEIGRVICEAASRVLGVDGAFLWLRRGDALEGCAAAGPVADQFIGMRRSLADSFAGQIYRDGDALVVNDFPHSPYRDQRTPGFRVQALLAMPLRRGGEPVGVLVFTDSVDPQRFTAERTQQASIFGAQAAVAIEAALAREREEDEGRVSTALLQVGRAIRESLEEAEILPQIARSACEVLLCDWSVVGLWDQVREVMRVTTTEGWPPDSAEELKLIEFSSGSLRLVSRLLAHETVELTEPTGRVELWDRWRIRSLLAVPMVRAGRIVGALVVGHRERRGAFSPRERRIAEGIAAQAAVAVDNARLVEALRRANALKTEFLGMMSHELRTPLSAILGYAELMQEGAMGVIGAEQSEALERILVHGRTLLELIGNTLDVNRLEAGRITLEPSEFGLGDLLAEIRTEFVLGVDPNVVVQWPDVVADDRCYTDRSKLKLVLRNLVDNALKFTAEGTVTITADVSDASRLRVSVRDTGRGIPADALPSVFEMFQQVQGHVTSRGVGLGLYLVRRYAQLMGGAVQVESAVGEGSTFTLELPRRLPGAS
ncbi:MAG TPA: GAF domain-containing protein [Candidatus Binatia bacterium]|nr:GAF domain-containing protein [Candidatus Binatia bacterium]